MKPKRPTETDLLAVVQNGFQEQLSMDREPSKAQVKDRARIAALETEDPPLTPRANVRMTLSIPEELRYRIKLSVMDQRRKGQPRLTQDEFCTEALRLHFESQDLLAHTICTLEKVRVFLDACNQAKAFTRARSIEASAMVGMIEKALGSCRCPTPGS